LGERFGRVFYKPSNIKLFGRILIKFGQPVERSIVFFFDYTAKGISTGFMIVQIS